MKNVLNKIECYEDLPKIVIQLNKNRILLIYVYKGIYKIIRKNIKYLDFVKDDVLNLNNLIKKYENDILNLNNSVKKHLKINLKYLIKVSFSYGFYKTKIKYNFKKVFLPVHEILEITHISHKKQIFFLKKINKKFYTGNEIIFPLKKIEYLRIFFENQYFSKNFNINILKDIEIDVLKIQRVFHTKINNKNLRNLNVKNLSISIWGEKPEKENANFILSDLKIKNLFLIFNSVSNIHISDINNLCIYFSITENLNEISLTNIKNLNLNIRKIELLDVENCLIEPKISVKNINNLKLNIDIQSNFKIAKYISLKKLNFFNIEKANIDVNITSYSDLIDIIEIFHKKLNGIRNIIKFSISINKKYNDEKFENIVSSFNKIFSHNIKNKNKFRKILQKMIKKNKILKI